MAIKTNINWYGKSLNLTLKVIGGYNNLTPCIAAFTDDDQQFGRLTVNIDQEPLWPGEVIIKTYSENESWAPQVLKNLPHVFQDTGRVAESGYVKCPIYKFKGE
jgi:hypothetical protein